MKWAVVSGSIFTLLVCPLVVVLMGVSSTFAYASSSGAPQSTPKAYMPYVIRAGHICPEITPSIIAAQIDAESGWNPNAKSPAGAEGIAQFMPSTWKANGIDGDGDGKINVWDAADSIMTQGTYMCSQVDFVKNLINKGKAKGMVVELALAAYNAGGGAVEKYHGIPPYKETQNYVKRIMTLASSEYRPFLNTLTNGDGGKIVTTAMKYLGVPYEWGGTTAKGLDCSGLVQLVFKENGIKLPRVATDQANTGEIIYRGPGSKVPWDLLKPGDTIAFHSSSDKPGFYHHIGIYIGDKKMIHAPKKGEVVKIVGLAWFQSEDWSVSRH